MGCRLSASDRHLYRIHSGGTMTVTEGMRSTHYEVGHEIELSEAEAARLNAGRLPGDYRVVRVGGELEIGAVRAKAPPRSVEAKVSSPGMQGLDELRGAVGENGVANHALSKAEIEAARVKAREIPVDTKVTFTDEAPAPDTTSTPTCAPGGVAISEAIAALPIDGENLLPAAETPAATAADAAVAAAAVSPGDDEVAPDWATYLAGVSAAEAAETLRTLESASDVQTALDAESGIGGKRRPLVIRAGNAALRRLQRT